MPSKNVILGYLKMLLDIFRKISVKLKNRDGMFLGERISWLLMILMTRAKLSSGSNKIGKVVVFQVNSMRGTLSGVIM